MGKNHPRKISAHLSHFLKVLTKPQRKYLLIYLVGLIWLVKFRSIREIACHFGQHNTDGLHHFIKNSAKKTDLLAEAHFQQTAGGLQGQQALMILDDTTCPRNGKRIEGLGIHHGIHGLVRGLCAVTAIVKVGHKRLAWAVRGYQSKKSCAPGTFKSKVDLAVEILEQARLFFRRGLTVLLDSWYACASVLNLIQEGGWTFLTAIKANRFLIVNGKKVSARHLAKGPRKYRLVRLSKKKRFRVAQQRVFLPQIGPVLVFITKSRGGIRFFVTNNLEMTESEMVRLYTQRFDIELFHKDIKQHLGFTEIFMRSWSGVQTHWTLLAIAYNLIALSNNSPSRSFRQMIRHFRHSVSHDTLMNLSKLFT